MLLPVNDQVLAAGHVMRRSDQQRYPYEMVWLDASWIDGVLTLQERILAGLDQRSLLEPLSREECVRILGPQGMAAGVRVAGQLVGFFALFFPQGSEENLGLDLGLPAAELLRTLHMEMVLVHPDYRGNSLQKQLMKGVMGAVADAGTYRWACATIHPANMSSIATVLSLGFLVAWAKCKYGGRPRLLFLQDLVDPIVVGKDRVVEAPAGDLHRHREILGGGFLGFGLTGTRQAPRLVFGPVQGHRPPIQPVA